MADKSNNDLFMIFCEEETAMKGECTTQLTPDGKTPSDLVKGFEEKAMFEISRFSFGVGTDQGDDDEDSLPPGYKEMVIRSGGKMPPLPPRKKSKRNSTTGDSPVTVQPVTFTRPMDIASSLLLSAVIQRTYFKKVAILKRKSGGGRAAGEPYLRLDFRGVLLTEASWTNDDQVEESYTFQARAITMRYKPQLEDGSLGAAKIGFWSMVPNEKEAPL